MKRRRVIELILREGKQEGGIDCNFAPSLTYRDEAGIQQRLDWETMVSGKALQHRLRRQGFGNGNIPERQMFSLKQSS